MSSSTSTTTLSASASGTDAVPRRAVKAIVTDIAIQLGFNPSLSTITIIRESLVQLGLDKDPTLTTIVLKSNAIANALGIPTEI